MHCVYIRIYLFVYIYRIILSSLVIGIKLNEDHYFDNLFYAKVGGVTKKEINAIEYEFLAKVNFNVYINDNLYYKYHNYLLKTNERYEKMIIEDELNKQHKELILSENEDSNTTDCEIWQWEYCVDYDTYIISFLRHVLLPNTHMVTFDEILEGLYFHI